MRKQSVNEPVFSSVCMEVTVQLLKLFLFLCIYIGSESNLDYQDWVASGFTH